jgi:hypothetical protein
MASKIGEVLEIKLEDSYIKRLVGPMITMETHDISKLARHSYPLHGRKGNHERYYTTKNPILGPPKSMLEMPPIWAFYLNLHNDQNPNLERKCSHKHSPNVE